MEDGPGTVTIVFTDMVGSTALRTRLGEERADELRRIHDRLLAGRIHAHGDRVVPGRGDRQAVRQPHRRARPHAQVEMDCLYEAPGPDTILAAAKRLGVPADAIIPVDEVRPEDFV